MEKYDYSIATLPQRIRNEIWDILRTRKCLPSDISEIRVRLHGRSCVYVGGRRFVLRSQILRVDIEECFIKLCEDSPYAHRDTISDGYVVARGGVRVGVCGRARYDGEGNVAISEITSLTYRIPSEEKIDVSALTGLVDGAEKGVLFFSPPRYGKTAALRALAEHMASGNAGCEVVVVDERGEFATLSDSVLTIDILSGYKKTQGIEIALRTLSPDVIVTDELSGREECERILDFLSGGVRVYASVHASEFSDLSKKEGVGMLLERGVFDRIIGIDIKDGERVYERYV